MTNINLTPNPDFLLLPPDPKVPTTTGLRWINGKGGGSFNDKTYGWYFNDFNVHQSSAGFDTGGEHDGGGSLTLSNNTSTARSSVTSVQVPCKPNTVYELTLYVETSNVPTGGVCAKINFFPSGATIANMSAITSTVSGDNHCVKLFKTFTTSSSTATLGFELRNTISGAVSYARFHDIQLVEKTDLVPIPVNNVIDYGVNSPFDILKSWNEEDFKHYCDKVVGFGGKWIRASFVHHYIHEVGSTSYNYSIYDTFVQIAASKGLKVLPILEYDTSTLGTQEFTDYFTNVAAHFKMQGIRYYEIWNEKNLFGTYNSNNDPAWYAQILTAVYPALKLGDPTCKVLFSGLTGGTIGDTFINDSVTPTYSPSDFLQGVYDAGAGNCFDIMNYHPYGHVEAVIQAVRTVMYNNGDESKQLWFTEDGIPTGGKPGQQFTTQTGQATYMTDSVTLAKKYSVAKHFFYNGDDAISAQPDREGYFGITSGPLNNLVNKLSYQAIIDAIAAS